jgi:hypothetical protein
MSPAHVSAKRKRTAPESVYVVRVGARYIERFSYPQSAATHSKPDKMWEAAEGILIAAACKAHLGDKPFEWRSESSARFVAGRIPGAKVVRVAGKRP